MLTLIGPNADEGSFGCSESPQNVEKTKITVIEADWNFTRTRDSRRKETVCILSPSIFERNKSEKEKTDRM